MKKVYFSAQFYDVIVWDFQVNMAAVSTLKINMAGFTIFDVEPDLKLSRANVRPQGKGSILLEKSHRSQTSTIPSLTKDTPFVHKIVNWLQSMAEGWQIQMSHNSSVIKIIEVHLISSHIYRCFDHLEKDFDVSASGRIDYINALLDLMDFRKFKGLNFDTLQNFSIVEGFLRKTRECMGKETRIHWKNNLDIDTLESKGSRATLKELQSILPHHLPRYKVIVENCLHVQP